ncbi:hypothetical protein [Stutzerimonas stutzeri]|uniref:hypothetical protein n=1 Tax=Stutzerimonas stutzeri TaxID=316 RepID=UPI001F3BF3C4|nr:hypothetical protein [Stutzerimonas stutzeri]
MPHVTFECYHGASATNANAIVRSQSIRPSKGRDHWYGDGVYFFIHGVTDALENAEKWANVGSWNNHRRCLTYLQYGVVQAKVTTLAERVFDLRLKKNLTDFERYKAVVVGILGATKKSIADYRDSMVFDLLAKECDLGVFIGDQCVLLTPEERRMKMISRIPNVTMLCARTHKDVSISDLTIVAKGGVSND